jgi:hypothetical protein
MQHNPLGLPLLARLIATQALKRCTTINIFETAYEWIIPFGRWELLADCLLIQTPEF